MKVEELSQYGKTLSGLPKEAVKKQEGIVLREIRKKFGLIGILPFFIRLFLGQRRLIRKYPEAYQATLKLSESTAKEITMLISMFNFISQTAYHLRCFEYR
ncbi:hypothetical protein ACFLRP_03160 [Bacteroidota bacterium]